ncbi:glycosyl transferase family 2 [Rathayibacter caricis DSM 15933]|uniref:4,4'-diaponeurosporenoate glycosyltransferase n=1 Tax=Rathayibacter caricis DSM 15933 TaxID=1328867 RepID=A0A2T4UVT5_9MICO|nr:glycosyltransferase family 2 protein [Rathayibacter caricis]MCJ1694730.1 glycosyltransferase family 2 protein [Rathayibacter caricis]PTL73642.1 glycosyl transferase family 2 [Rathayibacter caricis DSM 15933]
MEHRRISVVVPVKDDARHLERLLALLAEQTLAPLEVVVVDDGSTDDSAEVARAFGARVVVHEGSGIPASTAFGFDAAEGDVLARLDADSQPGPDWIARLAGHFADPTVGAVTGPGRFVELSPLPRLLARVVYMDAYFALMGSALSHWPLFGSNCAIRRSAWQEIAEEMHREDSYVHDDVEISVHLGVRHRIVLDRHLEVGISARPFGAARDMMRRLDRALHTLRRHPGLGDPVLRWTHRVRRSRIGRLQRIAASRRALAARADRTRD